MAKFSVQVGVEVRRSRCGAIVGIWIVVDGKRVDFLWLPCFMPGNHRN